MQSQELDLISTRVTNIKNQFTPTEKTAEESVAAKNTKQTCCWISFSHRGHTLGCAATGRSLGGK